MAQGMEGPAMTHAYEWKGRTVVGSDGEKIGTLDEVYLDTATGQPEWAAVKTGLFGLKQTFVPITEATPSQGNVQVPFTKDAGHTRPRASIPTASSPRGGADALRALRARVRGTDRRDSGEATVGRDVSGPTTDDAMTRSEEELHVGTAERETRPGPAAQVRGHRGGPADGAGAARGDSRRARADHRLATSTRRSTAPRSPRRSTRSCFTRRSS